jgi:hypothetical protein
MKLLKEKSMYGSMKQPRSMIVMATLAIAALALSGCQSSQQTLANEQEAAMQTALKRGQFELDCPSATASVLSSDMLQPILWRGTERAEYQIGVSGCNKRATYVVVCPLDSTGCVAGASPNN